MGTSTGRLRDLIARCPGDQIMGRSRDVPGTSVKHVFWIQLTNALNLLWKVTQDFKGNGSSEKFNKLYSG